MSSSSNRCDIARKSPALAKPHGIIGKKSNLDEVPADGFRLPDWGNSEVAEDRSRFRHEFGKCPIIENFKIRAECLFQRAP
jgi:hypothetical protein